MNPSNVFVQKSWFDATTANGEICATIFPRQKMEIFEFALMPSGPQHMKCFGCETRYEVKKNLNMKFSKNNFINFVKGFIFSPARIMTF